MISRACGNPDEPKSVIIFLSISLNMCLDAQKNHNNNNNNNNNNNRLYLKRVTHLVTN